MALIYNCNDNVTTTAFISRLEINHFFYKHLVKYDVTNMKDILSRTQKVYTTGRSNKKYNDCSIKYETEASHKT